MQGDPAVPGGVGPAVSWPELMAAMSLACDTAMALPLERVGEPSPQFSRPMPSQTQVQDPTT
jgi:hypothetical protein